MHQIGVWEQGEGLGEAVSALLRGRDVLVRCCSHPGMLAGVGLDLLVVSPEAALPAAMGRLVCAAALLPCRMSAVRNALPAQTVVSYGTCHESTITLSGLRGGQAAVAVQREFSTLDGRRVEQQELVLDYDGRLTAELFLARVGTQLLLGCL